MSVIWTVEGSGNEAGWNQSLRGLPHAVHTMAHFSIQPAVENV